MQLELFPNYQPQLPPRTLDESHPFYKKHVTFTGTLSSMRRQEAKDYVERVGGYTGCSVSRKTDILVVGQLRDSSSLKLSRAQELGAQVMTEYAFLSIYMKRM